MPFFTSQADIDAAEGKIAQLTADLAARTRDRDAAVAVRDGLRRDLAEQQSERETDKAKAAADLAQMRELRDREKRRADDAEKEVGRLRAEAASNAIDHDAQLTRMEKANEQYIALADGRLATAQERLRAAQALHDAEAARHAATRAAAHVDRLAHAETATSLAQMQTERATLVQRAENGEAAAAAARAQADAETAAFREHIDRTKGAQA